MPRDDDFALELRGDMPGRIQNQRDPLAIAVAAVSLITQVGVWVWWGGKIDQRVQALESEREMVRHEQRAKVDIDGLQTTQIAVLESKLEDIRQSVDRIDRKIPERK